jgi:predicted nucleic acid-binding protein
MTEIVIDASVTLAAMMEEAHSAQARIIMRRVAVSGAYVPSLWHLEVGNILLLAERRRKLTEARRLECLADLEALPVTVDTETKAQAWGATTMIALRRNLTLYDAAYLELAQRRGLPLATFDAALSRAAAAEGLEMV